MLQIFAGRRFMAAAAGTVALVLILALIVATLSQNGVAAQTPSQAGGTGQGATIPVQTAPAERTSLQQTTTVLGEIQPDDRVQIVARTSARVTQLPADVGQIVQAGDVLVELDRANQEAALSQAQAQLAVARASLSKIEAGARPEDVAAARAAAQQAAERLAQAQTQATEVRAQDLANAQAAVEAAEARLRQVTQGATEADIANAEAALRGAQARYQQVLSGAKPQDIDVATQALNQQKESRARLESQLATAKEQARIAMEQAADAVRSAQAAYGAAKLVYDEAERTGKDPNVPEVKGAPKGSRDLTDIKLRQYKADYEAKQLALSQAETALEARRIAYEDAKKQEIASLQQADAAIQQAQANLDKVKAGPSAEEAEAARATVDQAQAMLDKLGQPAREPDVAAAQAAVEQARANLAKLQALPTDVGAAQAAVAQQEALALKAADPYLPADLESAQAQVLVAEAAIKAAEANLRDTTITAPFTGVVSAKNVSIGSLAAPGTVLLELISLEVRGIFTIEEAAVGNVQVGQAVVLTATAYPGQTFAGTVSVVNPTANATTRSFGLRITPNDPSGQLRPGMSAQAEFVAAQRSDIIAVPETAVLQRDGKAVLFTVVDGIARQREVTTGLRADGKIEITSGLQAGEAVIVVGQNIVADGDAVEITPR